MNYSYTGPNDMLLDFEEAKVRKRLLLELIDAFQKDHPDSAHTDYICYWLLGQLDKS